MTQHGTFLSLVVVLLYSLTAIIGVEPGTAPRELPVPRIGATAATPESHAWAADPILYEAVSPAYRQAIMAATERHLPRYTLSATLSPPDNGPANAPVSTPGTGHGTRPGATPAAGVDDTNQTSLLVPAFRPATITGVLNLEYVNTTGTQLSELPFRLYPNLRQYGSGRMVIHRVTVDGQDARTLSPALHSVASGSPVATPTTDHADLILIRVILDHALAVGDAVSVRMDFTTTVPIEPPDNAGRFRYIPASQTWVLGHWFPMLAGYDPSSGWEIDPPAAWSDLTFANTALFDVTLTVPRDLVVVTTGVEVDHRVQSGGRVTRFTSGPVRDFAIVADPGLVSASAESNGTTLTAFFLPQDAAGGPQVLAWATRALAAFTELFGPYPYTTLDLVAVPGVTGQEFPQLIFIGAGYFPDPANAGSRPGTVEFLVAHEVAHQWWYGLVGSNPHKHAFLDEGLAQYSAVLYFEYEYGLAAARAHLNAGLVLPYVTQLLTRDDRVVDQPTGTFPDEATYYATAYAKAALAFSAIRDTVGRDAFVAGLRNYAAKSRFDVASPDELLAALEGASAGNLDELWQRWVTSAGGRVEIVMGSGTATPAATPAAAVQP